MRAVRIFTPWPLLALLAVTAVGPRSGTPEPLLAPLAHSALLSLEGAPVPGALILRLRASSGDAAVPVSDISVTIDGRDSPATPRADGSWRVALPGPPAGSEAKVQVAVTHDGVRELLSASIPVVAAETPATPAGNGVLSGAHKQIVWWVLNIAIVLVAALVISRRTS